jgi:hypothetical protein
VADTSVLSILHGQPTGPVWVLSDARQEAVVREALTPRLEDSSLALLSLSGMIISGLKQLQFIILQSSVSWQAVLPWRLWGNVCFLTFSSF